LSHLAVDLRLGLLVERALGVVRGDLPGQLRGDRGTVWICCC